jgi:putative tricarboxylic transport membrane protein
VTPPPSARVDLIAAAMFFAFGAAVMFLSWQMPTFVDVGGTPFTAPGIVPGFHGTIIALLSLAYAIRSVYRGALQPGGGKPVIEGDRPQISLTRLAIAVALCLIFSVVLVTRIPFWLAVGLFVTAFIVIFEWPHPATRTKRIRRIVTAALVGAAAGGFMVAVFQEIFLVRLP